MTLAWEASTLSSRLRPREPSNWEHVTRLQSLVSVCSISRHPPQPTRFSSEASSFASRTRPASRSFATPVAHAGSAPNSNSTPVRSTTSRFDSQSPRFQPSLSETKALAPNVPAIRFRELRRIGLVPTSLGRHRADLSARLTMTTPDARLPMTKTQRMRRANTWLDCASACADESVAPRCTTKATLRSRMRLALRTLTI